MNRKPPITFKPGLDAAFGSRPHRPASRTPLAAAGAATMFNAACGARSLVSLSVRGNPRASSGSRLEPSVSRTHHLCVFVSSGASFRRDFSASPGAVSGVGGLFSAPLHRDERKGQTCRTEKWITQRWLGLCGEAPKTRRFLSGGSEAGQSSPQSFPLRVPLCFLPTARGESLRGWRQAAAS